MNSIKFVEDVIEQAKVRAQDLTRFQDTICAARSFGYNDSYVVISGTTFALKFDIVDNLAINPQPIRVEDASRFSKRDAERVAASVKNGHGEVATAMHIEDAIDLFIKNAHEAVEVFSNDLKNLLAA